MKKNKILNVLLVAALIFISGICGVKAMEISVDEIENSTYIIGTHMLTRNQNENYDGKLTTPRIMLASTTIKSSNINDMLIYYKNPRGQWQNGLTGETITNMPSTFYITHIDLLLLPTKPILTINKNSIDANGNLKIKAFASPDVELGVYKEKEPYELYYSTSIDGTYEKIGTCTTGGQEECVLYSTIPYGQTYYFKVRTYKAYINTKIYSEYSNVCVVSNILKEPSSDSVDIKKYTTGTYVSFKYSFYAFSMEGMEVYYSESQDGQYSLLDIYQEEEVPIDLPVGKWYVKVRFYNTFTGEKIYTDYFDAGIYEKKISVTTGQKLISSQDFGNAIYKITPTATSNQVDGVDGTEIYYSTSKDGEYQLLTTSNLVIPPNQTFYYKARAYETTLGIKKYSPYSSTYSISNNYIFSLNFFDESFNTTFSRSGMRVTSDKDFDEIDLYYATSKNGEYVLNQKITSVEEMNYNIKTENIFVDIPIYSHYYFKARVCKFYGADRVCSAISDIIDYNNLGGEIYPDFDVSDYTIDADTKNILTVGYKMRNSKGNQYFKRYFSNEIDGTYVEDSVYHGSNADFYIDVNTQKYIKVKLCHDLNETEYCSEFSDPFLINSTKYNITYNLDGGYSTTEGTNPNVYFTTKKDITLIKPYKNGYTFIGWTGSNGEIPQINVTIPSTTTGDLNYVANWSLGI